MFRLPGRGAVVAATALTFALMGAGSASAATFNVDIRFDEDDADCDVGDCSLREAVKDATATPGADIVRLPAGRFYLGNDGLKPVPGNPITVPGGTVDLVGAGSDDTIIDGSYSSRIFHLVETATLNISDVTLRGGYAKGEGSERACAPQTSGGAVYVGPHSTLTLTDAVLENNRARNDGGAIFSDNGHVELDGVHVHANLANGSGGGLSSCDGTVGIVDSYFEGNSAGEGSTSHPGGGNGGAIDYRRAPQQQADTCTDDECTVADVAAAEPNGSVALPVTIDSSTFAHNTADGKGGAIALEGNEFGGGGSSFAAREGTGGDSGPQLPVPNVTIVNSTIASNSADADVQLPGGGGVGGGLYADHKHVAFVNSTIAGNTNIAVEAGGANITADGSNVMLRNTIVAHGNGEEAEANCNAFVVDLGNNIDSGDNCGITETSSSKKTDPLLLPLRDNGGPTPTMGLKPASPAIDKAAVVSGLGFDQRGGDRPPAAGSPGTAPDIGAYEAYSLADLAVEAKFDAPDPVTVGNTLSYPIVVRNNGPDTIHNVELEDVLPDGVTLVGVTSSHGTCSAATCNLGSLAPGTVVRLAVTVTPTATGTVTNSATVSAESITDPDPTNDSASAATTVGPAPAAPQGTNTTTTVTNTVTVPGPTTPSQSTETDDDIDLKIKVPKTITVDEFMDGFNVEAECVGEKCLRKFREHAAINTGATHIAGFNLTVSRMSLGFVSKTIVKLQPCKSGADAGRRHKRCLRNLRKAAEKAKPFRVKVVVAAVDKAGNRAGKKAFVTVK